jgi:hypothetical protein
MNTLKHFLLCFGIFFHSLQAAADPSTTRVQTTVYRCQQNVSAALIFQSHPCDASAQQQRLDLIHVEPPAPQTTIRSGPINRQRTKPSSGARGPGKSDAAQNRAQSETRPAFARKSRAARAKAGQSTCPPTREGSVATGSTSLATAWKRHQSLPSRTYLKNAGKWPAHCPN